MKRVLTSLALVVSLSTLSVADNAKKNVKLTTQEQQEMVNSEFEMPPAGDLVNVLTKDLGKINWNSFIIPVGKKKYSSNEDMALNLGIRGADVYFLAASKDTSNLISVSTEVNFLLNKIVVKNKSLNDSKRKKRLKKLKDLVKQGKWDNVLKEIGTLQSNIDSDFVTNDAKSLKLLNDTGGWIEGYRLAVEGFNKNFKADKTDILIQTDLISYLKKSLQSDANLKSFKKTPKLLKTLSDIEGVLKGAKDKLNKSQIEQLNKILSETKQYI